MTNLSLAKPEAEVAGHGLPDETLIARVVGGELPLFELLIRRHNARVYRTVRAILGRDEDCEDVMQQTYISAFRHLDQFRRDASFSTWLTRIAVNAAIKRGRREYCRPEVALTDTAVDAGAATAPNPEHTAYGRELGVLIDSAVDALPDTHRAVFVLREIEGLSTSETAETLGVNEDLVKTRLHRAKTSLRAQITSRLGVAAPLVYAFHLMRCDRVVMNVKTHLGI